MKTVIVRVFTELEIEVEVSDDFDPENPDRADVFGDAVCEAANNEAFDGLIDWGYDEESIQEVKD